jgi:hypothetical protein
MSSAGGRLSWQKTVSVRTSIVPPGPCPPPADTPHALPVVTTSQVKDALHDFAVPLIAAASELDAVGWVRVGELGEYVPGGLYSAVQAYLTRLAGVPPG